MSLVAFLNVEKYPPSLQLLLMTLGPGILALAAFDGIQSARNAVEEWNPRVSSAYEKTSRRQLFRESSGARVRTPLAVHLSDLDLAEPSDVFSMSLVRRVQAHASPVVAQLLVVLEATERQMTIRP
jgi:hypothetical protein